MEIVHVQPNWSGLSQICHNMDRMPFRLYELKCSYFALMQGKKWEYMYSLHSFWTVVFIFDSLQWEFLITCCPLSIAFSVCASVSKVFTFSTFAPERLAQFSTKIGAKYCTCILGWVGIEFLMECCLVCKELMTK